MNSFTLNLPTCINLGKNKVRKYHLNFNNYHNWHHMVRNQIKKKFQESLFFQLQTVEKMEHITMIEYSVFHRTNRKFDVSNKIALIDKFFQDALVQYCKIEDDNFNYIKSVKYQYGGKAEDDFIKVEVFYN